MWLLSVSSLLGQSGSYNVTNTETSDPPNLFATRITVTNYFPGSPTIYFQTQTAPTVSSSYHFTHWTLNGQRVEDITGQSVNPAPFVFTNNIDAVAHYVPTNQYTADQLVPDWYKIVFFNRTNIDASSDSDGDGLDLGTEFLRGYHPRLFDQAIEGGISRRRSSSVTVIVDTNYARITVSSDPFGLVFPRQDIVLKGTNYSLPAQPAYDTTRYAFIGWYTESNRVDDPRGFSSGNLSLIVTNDRIYTAKFLPLGTDNDVDGLDDGYELYYFNSLTNTPSSNPSGDGFNIATDILRGYQPNVFNEIVEGGVSRRRSSSVTVIVDTNYARITVSSDPFGLVFPRQDIVLKGTNYSLPAQPAYDTTRYTFVGWYAESNRVDDPHGFSSGNLSLIVTNDRIYTAKFLPLGTDNDVDGLDDGYELYYFNSLTNTPSSNPSGDGFNIATAILRGYQPNVFNEIIEGGISRRRSALFQFVPAPPDFAVQPQNQTVQPGTNITLTFIPRGVPPFRYQWRLNGINLVGATNGSLTISNAQPTDSGAYSVVLGNSFGFNTSTDALLVVTSPDLGLADDIENRSVTNSYSGLGSGQNVSATHQLGEPNHAGKFGSNSVWMGWTAPATGIATFTTRGSSFDTVMAVYVRHSIGSPASVTNLDLVASDDDRGGYLTSLVQFNASAGTEYLVAIDGFVRATGNIVLSWGLQATNTQLPTITQQPVSVTVALGASTSFSVSAASSLPLTYQWIVDGAPIAGATNTTLLIPDVQVVNVGNYQVRVSNGAGEVISDVAFLQINITAPDGHAQQVAVLEKLADAPGGGNGGSLVGLYKSKVSVKSLDAITSFGFSSPPARGFSGAQIYTTLNNGSGSAVAWFKLQADGDGPLLVTTEGSQFDTYFTVYTGPANAISTAQLTGIAFAYNGGADYRTRRITFNAKSNTVYYIRLDGVNQYGKVWLGWVLGYQATIQFDRTSFRLSPTNTSVQTLQWFFNEKPIAGQTNLILAFPLMQDSSEGDYSVLLTNLNGQVTRDKLYLRLFRMSAPQVSNNIVRVQFGTTYGLTVQVQASSNFSNWTTIYTNNPSTQTNEFIDSQPLSRNRFYRFRFP